MSCQNIELADVKFIPIRNTAASQKLEDEEDYQCGICSASFNSQSSLLEHVELKHRRNKQFREEQQQQPKLELKTCLNCGTKFRNDFDLYKHRRDGCHHAKEDEAKNVPEENQLQRNAFFNQCSECGQNFKFRIQLFKHEKIHYQGERHSAQKKETEIPVGKKESKNEKFRKTSCGNKLYACPKSWCNFRSKFKGSINIHLKGRHHEGAEIFKCDLCPFQSFLSGNLKQHKRIHSEEKPFACSFANCDFRSRWMGNLRVHEARQHTKEVQLLGPKKIDRPKKSGKKQAPKISLEASKPMEKSDELVQTRRTLSRQRSQVHQSLCEDLLVHHFQWQSQPCASPDLQNCRTSDQGTFSGVSDNPEINDIRTTRTQLTSNDPDGTEITDAQQPPRTSHDLQHVEMQIPQLPVPSNIPGISEFSLISPARSTEKTEMNQPGTASAPRHAQKKYQKLTKKAVKAAAALKRTSLPLGSREFQCPHCPYRTKTEWILRGHLVGHGAAEPYYCYVENCNFQTKWQNYLYSHMRKVHSTRYILPGRSNKMNPIQSEKKCGGRKPEKLANTKVLPPSVKFDHSVRLSMAPSKATGNALRPRKDPSSNSFLCPFTDCGFKTLYEFNMSRHLKTHRKIGTFSYSCSKCKGKFPNAPALGRHKRHCGSQLPASRTPKVSSSALNTSTSVRPEKSEVYTCTVPDCNFKTRFGPNLLRHQQGHEKYGVFAHTCLKCQRKFATSAALLRHRPKCARIIPASQTAKTSSNILKSSQAEAKLYTCAVPDCNFQTHLTASWLFHRRSHQKYGNFVHNCAKCQRKFATRAALRRHSHHCTGLLVSKTSGTRGSGSASMSSQVEQPTGRWYTCAVADCNFKTRHTSNMWYHRRSHTKYGNFVHTCVDCHRKFATHAALLRHGPMCTKTSAANCPVRRGQKFRKKQYSRASVSPPIMLTAHDDDPQKTSSLRKKLKCPDCPYEARDQWVLNRHSIIHTCKGDMQPTEDTSTSGDCTFCSYMSRLAKYLTKHMTKCPGCHKSTNQNLTPQVPLSTSSPAPHVPNGPAPSTEAANFACMLCGYVAQSESHALDHSHAHKTAIVALERLSDP